MRRQRPLPRCGGDILNETLTTAADVITLYEEVMAEQATRLEEQQAEIHYLKASNTALMELVSSLILADPSRGLRN
jgi:hypothetical protein